MDVHRSDDHLEGTFTHIFGDGHAAFAHIPISCQENQISFSWQQDNGPHHHIFNGSYSGTLAYDDSDRPRRRIYEIDNIHATVNGKDFFINAMIYYRDMK